MDNLKPIGSNIFFVFDDEVKNGHFVEKRFSGIVVDIGKNHAYSSSYSRTGRVLAVGDAVKQIKVNDNIVIRNMMWTDRSFKHNDERFWMTNEQYVMGTVC
jgi:co-chaperonin GroES (HSP10)